MGVMCSAQDDSLAVDRVPFSTSCLLLLSESLISLHFTTCET